MEDVARFVSWLRAPADNVICWRARRRNGHRRRSTGMWPRCSTFMTITPAGEWRRPRSWWRGDGWAGASYKPFLHHVTKGRPIPTRPVKLVVPHRVPGTLAAEEVAAIVAACERLRDRFLFCLLAETGMRIGQALGLRHADFVSRAKEAHIVPRDDNANGARAKLRRPAVIPLSAPLVRLYSDYMHSEYGEIDSDYVFVNLWSGRDRRAAQLCQRAQAGGADP